MQHKEQNLYHLLTTQNCKIVLDKCHDKSLDNLLYTIRQTLIKAYLPALSISKWFLNYCVHASVQKCTHLDNVLHGLTQHIKGFITEWSYLDIATDRIVFCCVNILLADLGYVWKFINIFKIKEFLCIFSLATMLFLATSHFKK